MCGNGARVFARYLIDSGLADGGPADGGPTGGRPAAAGEIVMLTRSGPVTAVVAAAAADPDSVTVEMRVPRVVGAGTAAVAGHEFGGVTVDCGNPHLVCAVPAGFDLGALDLTAPPDVDGAAFPAGVNVEFCAPVAKAPAAGSAGHVRMRVHERGVGETMSCGSGACAVAAVTLRASGQDRGVVIVDVAGGQLTVTLDGTSCRLTGAAVIVAHGTVDLTALRSGPRRG
jgi:diaminopimelate epimerase